MSIDAHPVLALENQTFISGLNKIFDDASKKISSINIVQRE